MSRPGVLGLGDRIAFDGACHTIVGLAGTALRLRRDDGAESVVQLTALLNRPDLELLDAEPAHRLAPFGLPDALPVAVVEMARMWERHVVEVDTGLPPDATSGMAPRDAYDPSRRTLAHGRKPRRTSSPQLVGGRAL